MRRPIGLADTGRQRHVALTPRDHAVAASAAALRALGKPELRLARADVYKIREQRIKQWSAERDTALDAARKAASQKVRQAKAELEAEAVSARQAIQASAADLADLAVRAVLPLPLAAGGSR